MERLFSRAVLYVVLVMLLLSVSLTHAANITKPSNFTIVPPFRGSTTITTNSRAHTDNSAKPGWAQDFNAIDFMMPLNADVRPIAGGRVVYAGMAAGNAVRCTQWANLGRIIYIDHGNGYTSLYAHLNSATVKAGDTVTTNTVIGKVGKTTCANNAGMAVHLHVAAYRNANFAGGPYGGDSIELQPFANCVLADNSACTNLYRFRTSAQALTLVYTANQPTIVTPSENGTTDNGLIRITVNGGVAPYYLEVWRDGSSAAFIYQWMNGSSYQPDNLGWSQSFRGRLCARIRDSRGTMSATRCFSNGTATVAPTATVDPTATPGLPSCASVTISNFTASDRTNRDAIKLDWHSVQCGNDTKTYRVYEGNPGRLLVGNLTSSDYRHTGLSSGRTKTYWVVVCAIENGSRVCSQPVSATGHTR
jgi:hypothetical protein